MTPLAHHIARMLAEPVAKRPKLIQENADELRGFLSESHYFEVSAIHDMIDELMTMLRSKGDQADEIIGAQAFLPAPTTWIEWKMPVTGRIAIICREMPDGKRAMAWCVMEMDDGIDVTINFFGYISLTSGDIFVGHDDVPRDGRIKFLWPFRVIALMDQITDSPTQLALGYLAWAQLATVLINSPKVIGRNIHPVHAGLQRTLRNSGGHFPLRGWTELKLHVAKPREIDDGEPHEAFLTGRRALHFVRKFMRVRYNKIEYVTSHWRGDAAIGMKQTRYKVET